MYPRRSGSCHSAGCGAAFAVVWDMTKQTEHKGTANKATRAPGGGTHQWQGEAVERGSPVDENAEGAASRAEGNASLGVREALDRDRAAGDPSTFGLAGEDPSAAGAQSQEDEAEIEEEKRQAAVEDHAAGPPKHGPHGRL